MSKIWPEHAQGRIVQGRIVRGRIDKGRIGTGRTDSRYNSHKKVRRLFINCF
jgi:hypothetical protein